MCFLGWKKKLWTFTQQPKKIYLKKKTFPSNFPNFSHSAERKKIIKEKRNFHCHWEKLMDLIRGKKKFPSWFIFSSIRRRDEKRENFTQKSIVILARKSLRHDSIHYNNVQEFGAGNYSGNRYSSGFLSCTTFFISFTTYWMFTRLSFTHTKFIVITDGSSLLWFHNEKSI